MDKLKAYVDQAAQLAADLASLLNRVEAGANDWPTVKGTLVSLQANLASAQDEVQVLQRD